MDTPAEPKRGFPTFLKANAGTTWDNSFQNSRMCDCINSPAGLGPNNTWSLVRCDLSGFHRRSVHEAADTFDVCAKPTPDRENGVTF